MVVFIDSFLFNGDDIVKLRLEYLYEYVDYFYIVESIYTHSGIRKNEFYIDKYNDWFTPYLDKIRFVKINDLLQNDLKYLKTLTNCRIEENYQRNYIRDILLKDFSNKDFILALCDVDEIYDITKLEAKKELFDTVSNKMLLLQMKMYYYNFNYLYDDNWEMAFITSSNILKNHNDLNHIRIYKLGENTIRRKCGWHFSNFMKPEEVLRKLSSFFHNDLNVPPYNNIDYIKFVMEKGIDLFNRKDKPLKYINYNDSFNEYPELFRKYYQ